MTMQKIIISLLLEQPFYGHVAASLPIAEGNVPSISFQTEPHLGIRYNKQWLETQPDDQAKGALLQKLLHFMLLHPYRRGGRDQALWSIACEMAVNEHIPYDWLAKDAITVKAMRSEVSGLQDGKSAEEYYNCLKQTPTQLSLFKADLKIRVVLSSGAEVQCDAMEDESDGSMGTVVKGLLSEKIRQSSEEAEPGAELAIQLGSVYRSEGINWRSILKRFLTGRGRFLTRKSYKRVSRRFVDFPGNKHATGIDVLVAIDESGSIPLATLQAFYSEVLSLQEITGISMMVTKFDTTCTKPVSAKQFPLDSVRVKSGGTDFRPVFELADSLRIPLLILFTDGDGPAPLSANQKTLWVLTPGGKKPCTFGESVVCDIGEGVKP